MGKIGGCSVSDEGDEGSIFGTTERCGGELGGVAFSTTSDDVLAIPLTGSLKQIKFIIVRFI